MRKLKLFMAAFALTGWGNFVLAQTDVTSTYITKADFSSTEGWTQEHSTQYWTLGNGLIGTYAVANEKISTTDATHLATEYCFGIQCRWQTNYAAFTQATEELPVGVYTLTYDVQNTNACTSATYQNRFTVVAGGSTYTDSSTEWMKGTSGWTTHTINFTVNEATTATISLGYGTGSNNIASDKTPHLYVSHLKLTWTDILQGAKDALQAEIDKAKLCDAKEELADAIAAAESTLTNATTVAELETALATLQAADKDAVLRYENGLADATYAAPIVTSFVVNGKFDSNTNGWSSTGGFQNGGTASNQSGAFTVPFWENWNGSAKVNKMYQTISNIPNGTYRLDIAAFVNTLADPNESQFVFANSDKTYLTSTTPTAYEVYTVVTNNQIEIGLEQTTATANWMGIDNVSLRYYGAGDVINDAQNASHKLAWEEAKAAAEAAIANTDFANVTGSEKTALQAEIDKAEPTTAEGYDEAAAALTAATATFTAAAPAYNELIAEIAYAQTIAIATETAQAALNINATAATVIAATQALKVSEYQGIQTGYPNDVTSMLGSWDKGSYDTNSGQGYAGSDNYFNKWSGSATDLTSSKALTLPAGKYAVMVAGRGVSTTTMNLSVKVGDADAVSTPFLMNGDTGKGIDTNGATNFSDESTYSNSNNGRGWQYRYITFVTDGTANVTIAINGHLNASTWQSFYAPVLLCDEDTYAPIALDAAKAALQTAIDAAPAVPTANVGENAFQIPANGVNTYAAAIEAAQAAHDATDATVVSIDEAKTALETAIQAYNALEINAPANGQLFNVILTYSGWTYNQKAMTYLANGRTDAGLYNIQYKEAANPNLAQAFTFTKVEGNKYKMSQIDADGNVRYISTGVPYNGNTSQIRTTTNAADALAVEVIPTANGGVWNLKNTAANNYIGSQDAGVYTVNSHIDFNLVETSKPSIAINTTAAGWGTTILPFAASKPSDVKVYTCAEAAGTTLTLVEVDALEANKPYIIEGSWNETLTGDAQGIQPTYTEGLLTGVYAESKATADTYVMQKQDNKVGFFKVAEGKEPTIKANRCYMTAPAGEARAAYFFDDNETTGINAIEALTSGDAQIFNAAGAQLPKLQKGMNIIRKADGTSFKVMVK